MVRKAVTKKLEETTLDEAALQEGAASLVVVSANAAAVAEMTGYDLPYNQDRVVQEARFYMGQSAEAMLEAGKRLLLLKENEGHGDFVRIVEENLGIPARTAQMMMQAAVKYLTNPALTSKAQTFALLGKSKMFELMTLDDDSLAELAEGGTVAGIKLDDVDRMSVRELKATLREARETAEATEKVMSGKNKRIDKLEADLERKKSAAPAEEWAWAPTRRELLDTCERIANFAHSDLRRALADIEQQAASSDDGLIPEEIEILQAQALTSAMQALIAVQKEFRVNVDLESLVSPPWMADAASSLGAHKAS